MRCSSDCSKVCINWRKQNLPFTAVNDKKNPVNGKITDQVPKLLYRIELESIDKEAILVRDLF